MHNQIVTAAHCLYPPSNFSSLSIFAGQNDLRETGTRYTAELWIEHEVWNFSNPIYYDIGLIKTVETILFTDLVKPIPLARTEPAASTFPIVLSGWGRWLPGPPGVLPPEIDFPPRLQHFNATYPGYQKCLELYIDLEEYFTEEQFCTFEGKGTAVCNCDSGGPVAYNGELLGIVSWGAGSCYGQFPDAHASVPFFYDWLQEKTQLL